MVGSIHTIFLFFMQIITGFYREFINKSNGQVKVEGDKYSMPALAKTLKTIAQKGIEAFYEGEIGEKFVQDVKERRGIITREDLINYE